MAWGRRERKGAAGGHARSAGRFHLADPVGDIHRTLGHAEMQTLHHVPLYHDDTFVFILRPAEGVDEALSRYRRSAAENVAGNRLHVVADAAAQVRNESARSSLKCGRRSR